jgi:hypothetical protein
MAGNNDDALSELRTLCREAPRQSTGEVIEESRLISLSGSPAPAEEGSLALRIDGDQTVTILEEDIVKTEKDEVRTDHFRVFVKPDSDLILTRTRVTSASEASWAKSHRRLASQRVRRSPFFDFGGCLDTCGDLEQTCLYQIGSPLEAPDLGEWMEAAGRCHNLWFDCAGLCLDWLFPQVLTRGSASPRMIGRRLHG